MILFNKIENGRTAELFIYDVVGESLWFDAVTPDRIRDELKDLGDGIETINLRINSEGGDVFDGVAISNILEQHPARVVAKVDGLAASIAAVIAARADAVEMGEGAFLMIHKPWSYAVGNEDELIAVAARLRAVNESSIMPAFAKRLDWTVEDVTKQVEASTGGEWWLDAEQAVSIGMADATFESRVAACIGKTRGIRAYRNPPEKSLVASGLRRDRSQRRVLVERARLDLLN